MDNPDRFPGRAGRQPADPPRLPPADTPICRTGPGEDRAAPGPADTPYTRPRRPHTTRAVHLVNTGIESVLWRTAEAISAQVGPAGPVAVRTVYLTRQLYLAARGLDSGAGFQFKISIPGLDQLPGGPIPGGWELVTRVRLGATGRPASELGIWSEIQIFRPWLHQVDVAAAEPPPTLGVPPARSVPPAGADPWAAWVALLGPVVMRDVSQALSLAVHRPVSDVRKAVPSLSA